MHKAAAHDKKIQTICLVSSAVFNAATCIYSWTAPIGAALGLAADLYDKPKIFCASSVNTEGISDISDVFEDAITKALLITEEKIATDSGKKILKELSETQLSLKDLQDLTFLIEKTETYREKYCTRQDSREIIETFENVFRSIIITTPILQGIYTASTGMVTFEKLKAVHDAIRIEGEKTNTILKTVNHLDERSDKIDQTVSAMNNRFDIIYKTGLKLINDIAFILISMAVCLIFGIIFIHNYDESFIIIALLCYSTSDFLVYCLKKSTQMPQIAPFASSRKKIFVTLSKNLPVYLIPLSITFSCFLLIVFATKIYDTFTFVLLSVGLLAGNTMGLFLKRFLFKDIS